MHIRLLMLTAALMVGVTPTWATVLPTYETYSAAADITNLFVYDPAYIPQTSVTTTPDATTLIAGDSYAASARTTLGSNHAYAQANAFPSGVFGAANFSGWYDQVTITGGTGTGTAQFSVQLNGTADVGAIAGAIGYSLSASSMHPSLLTSNTFNVSTTTPWALDATTPIASYSIAVSPYNDPNQISGLFATPPDLVLTPGAGQTVNLTLTGTLNFTYGESFYLIGGLGTMVADGLDQFCTFAIDGTCTPAPKDGTGATTLDFSHSANLVNIALPEGATATFASGTAYNVTAVPEPSEWLMLVAGLGFVGWRVRRKGA